MPENSMLALDQAQKVRKARKLRRAEIRSADPVAAARAVADMLIEVPEDFATIPIGQLLAWIPRLGPATIASITGGAGCSEHRRLNQLSTRQRGAIASTLRQRADHRAAA